MRILFRGDKERGKDVEEDLIIFYLNAVVQR